MFSPTLDKMHWQRPRAMYRNYELVSGYFWVGALNFKSSFSYEAEGEFNNRKYKLKRSGLFKHAVQVWDQETGGLVAEALTIWGRSGTITMGELNLHWKLNNRKRRIQILNRQNQILGSYRVNPLNRKTNLEFEGDFLSEEQRGLIALIGIYLTSLYGRS